MSKNLLTEHSLPFKIRRYRDLAVLGLTYFINSKRSANASNNRFDVFFSIKGSMQVLNEKGRRSEWTCIGAIPPLQAKR